MSTEDGSGAGPAKAAGWRRFLSGKWLAGVLTSVVVVPLAAIAFTPVREWFTDKVSPEQYLAAVVDVPSPQHTCISGEGWVFGKNPQQLPGVMPDEDKDAWAAENGGVPASGNIVEVTLQGLNGHTVVVTDVEVEVVSRGDALRGTYPYTGGQCGGMIPYRFQADLDTNPVEVTALADDGAVNPAAVRQPVDLPHSVSGSQPEVWHIAAVTESCTCEWTATLHWNSEGTEGQTEITDNGRPFRVAATTQAAHVATDYNGGWGPAY